MDASDRLTYYEAPARLALGEPEAALDLLERYVDAFPTRNRSVYDDWWFRSLSGHPRFERFAGMTGGR